MTHFINMSGETIPPFACMQICIPPEKWDAIKKLPLTDGAKEILINAGTMRADEFPRYDQDTVLYCIKPNFASALYQDSSTIAFNGPSYVEPKKQGVCSIGKYPAKAIASQFHYPYLGLSVLSQSWSLIPAATEFAAFRMLYPTTHELKKGNANSERTSEDDIYAQNMTQVEPNARKIEYYPLRAEGEVSMSRGENMLGAVGSYNDWPFNFVSVDEEYAMMIGYSFQNRRVVPVLNKEGLWFAGGRLEMPGTYRLRIAGKLEVTANPNTTSSVPVNFGLKFNPDSNVSTNYATELPQDPFLNFSISRYTVVAGPPPVYAFPFVTFLIEYVIRFRGQKGQLVFENRSSPFVRPFSFVNQDGERLRMDIARLNFNRIVVERELEWAERDFLGTELPAQPLFNFVYSPQRSVKLVFSRGREFQ